jgi:hypothetical protein
VKGGALCGEEVALIEAVEPAAEALAQGRVGERFKEREKVRGPAVGGAPAPELVIGL